MHARNRRLLIAALFTFVLVGTYLGVSGDGKAPERELYEPSRFPDRIILTMAGDPATTQSVTWRTDASVENPVAQIAPAQDGPDFTKHAKKVTVSSERLEAELGTAKYHTAHFTGLEPRTIYVYRVGDGRNWSEWNQFRTASDKPDPLTFVYVGDAQTDIYSMWSRLIRTGYSKAPQMDFLLHAGDLVNNGNSDAQWGEWFRAAGWINRSIPSIATPGNHEYPKGLTGQRGLLSIHWRPQFALPENGLPELAESSYYVDIQGVRMVILNSNERQEEQTAWLDSLLADNPNQWTILSFHHPMFSSAKGRDNKKLREAWQPIFDKHHVDLVLQGHDHTYARSNLLSGVNAQAGEFGTVYVVSVSGPKMYELEPNSWAERVAERTQLFQVIRVVGDRLEYEAYTARGILYDAFELRKRADGPNELTNKIPATPRPLGGETED